MSFSNWYSKSIKEAHERYAKEEEENNIPFKQNFVDGNGIEWEHVGTADNNGNLIFKDENTTQDNSLEEDLLRAQDDGWKCLQIDFNQLEHISLAWLRGEH